MTVVRVQPADDPDLPDAPADTTTTQDVVDLVTGPVNDFWHQQSGGQVTLDAAPATDTGWITTTADCSDPDALWAEAADKAGFPLTAEGAALPGQHLLLLLPEDDVDCEDGLGEVGRSLHGGGFLYARTSPDFDGYPAYQHDTLASVISHELGHNFGLLHSGSQECQGTVEGGTCDGQEYGDLYDVMGASWDHIGSLNAAQAARLGFLAAGEVQTIDSANAYAPGSPASSAYYLSPISGTTGTHAIKLTAGGASYYVEYRPASGRDAYLDQEDGVVGLDLPSGVLLHRVETTSDADSSTLLDGSPTSTADYPFDESAVLPVGQAVPIANGKLSVKVLGLTGGQVQLQVSSGYADTLPAGARMNDGQLTSPDGAFRAVLQGDGNLVVYGPVDGRVQWTAHTDGHPGAHLDMQGDGNLVLYGTNGAALWSSRTWGNPGTHLVLQDDGNLVLYRPDGRALWASGAYTGDTLRGGAVLSGGAAAYSRAGLYRLVEQSDGNLVVYRTGTGRAVWNSRTGGNALARAAMQTDGNLVVYAMQGWALWNARTGGNPGARTVVQDDGNLVVYRADGRPLWWSGPDPLR